MSQYEWLLSKNSNPSCIEPIERSVAKRKRDGRLRELVRGCLQKLLNIEYRTRNDELRICYFDIRYSLFIIHYSCFTLVCLQPILSCAHAYFNRDLERKSGFHFFFHDSFYMLQPIFVYVKK